MWKNIMHEILPSETHQAVNLYNGTMIFFYYWIFNRRINQAVSTELFLQKQQQDKLVRLVLTFRRHFLNVSYEGGIINVWTKYKEYFAWLGLEHINLCRRDWGEPRKMVSTGVQRVRNIFSRKTEHRCQTVTQNGFDGIFVNRHKWCLGVTAENAFRLQPHIRDLSLLGMTGCVKLNRLSPRTTR